MHFFKSIRTNKFSFLSFNVINISLSLLIFGIIFFYCSQITPLISLSKTLDSKNVYVIKGVEQINKYYSTEENNLRSGTVSVSLAVSLAKATKRNIIFK